MITPPEVPNEIGLRIVGEVKALHVTSPADVIVIRLDGPARPDEIERIIAQWRTITGLENQVAVLAGGADVKVMVKH